MTNREKLTKTALYDLLCAINKYIINKSITEDNCCNMCVIQALQKPHRCICSGRCEECIQNWLNEEAE